MAKDVHTIKGIEVDVSRQVITIRAEKYDDPQIVMEKQITGDAALKIIGQIVMESKINNK